MDISLQNWKDQTCNAHLADFDGADSDLVQKLLSIDAMDKGMALTVGLVAAARLRQMSRDLHDAKLELDRCERAMNEAIETLGGRVE